MEASRDMETGQTASSVMPILEPMVEQGVLAAMADPGTQEARPPLRLQLEAYYPPPKTILGRSRG